MSRSKKPHEKPAQPEDRIALKARLEAMHFNHPAAPLKTVVHRLRKIDRRLDLVRCASQDSDLAADAVADALDELIIDVHHLIDQIEAFADPAEWLVPVGEVTP